MQRWDSEAGDARCDRCAGRSLPTLAGRFGPLEVSPLFSLWALSGDNVVIVEDQALIREGFRFLLDSEPDLTVVGLAEHGAQGLELTKELRPEVVVMDTGHPGRQRYASR